MLTAGSSLMEVAEGAGVEADDVFEDALAALRQSFVVHEALGNDYGLALVENFTGLTYFNRGHIKAQDFRERRSVTGTPRSCSRGSENGERS